VVAKLFYDKENYFMTKKNEIIKFIDSSFISDEDLLFDDCIVEKCSIYQIEGSGRIAFKNCSINRFAIGSFICRKIFLENCVINDLVAVSARWIGGLCLKNCVVINSATFEAGGHNKEDVIIENNVFACRLYFFDTKFENTFIFRNNIILAGTDLLGNKDKGYRTELGNNYTVEKNIGDLELNE
jgi:hypothetical protein